MFLLYFLVYPVHKLWNNPTLIRFRREEQSRANITLTYWTGSTTIRRKSNLIWLRRKCSSTKIIQGCIGAHLLPILHILRVQPQVTLFSILKDWQGRKRFDFNEEIFAKKKRPFYLDEFYKLAGSKNLEKYWMMRTRCMELIGDYSDA